MLYDLLYQFRRRWVRIYGQGLVWLAGFILIAAGIICLYLSGQVVTGWWQGTLDAFGVGFIIAGIVDVLAISGLNQALTGQQNRQEYERQAQQVMLQIDSLTPAIQAQRAQDLLDRSGDQLNAPTRALLRAVVNRGRPSPPPESNS